MSRHKEPPRGPRKSLVVAACLGFLYPGAVLVCSQRRCYGILEHPLEPRILPSVDVTRLTGTYVVQINLISAETRGPLPGKFQLPHFVLLSLTRAFFTFRIRYCSAICGEMDAGVQNGGKHV
jgi:hypothetical protein